jgi:hypothetical protein
MRKLIAPVFFLVSIPVFAQEIFQLAPPILKYESVFFKRRAKLGMKFNQPGAEIHYTTNGKEPTINDLLYKQSLKITEGNYTITARTFASGLLPSEAVSVTFIKEGKRIEAARFSIPSPKYPGSGSATLIDNKGGIKDINSKTWLGYESDTVEIEIDLRNKQEVNKIILSLLNKTDSWIFLPEMIILYKFNTQTKLFEEVSKSIDIETQESKPGIILKQIFPDRPLITSKLMVQLIIVKKIPDGYPGKGQHGWLFIDEIKVY